MQYTVDIQKYRYPVLSAAFADRSSSDPGSLIVVEDYHEINFFSLKKLLYLEVWPFPGRLNNAWRRSWQAKPHV